MIPNDTIAEITWMAATTYRSELAIVTVAGRCCAAGCGGAA
jgi:hypothetical protein